MGQQQQYKPEGMLPSSSEAEKSILASILLWPDETYHELHFLTPEDFHQSKHRTIFEAIRSVAARHEPIDPFTVTHEIEVMGHGAELAGDPNYLYTLGSDTIGTTRSAIYHAHAIQKHTACRKIIAGFGQAVGPAWNGNADEAQSALEQLVYELHMGSGTSDPVPTRDMSSSFMERLDLLSQQKHELTGVPTHFLDLDLLTGGFQRSDLIILAARPAIGKTAAALTMARNAALKSGKGVVIFSLEMSQEQLYQRLISMEAGIDQKKLRTGWIDDEDWEKIIAAMERLDHASIWIDDTPGITCQEIESKVRRLVASGVQVDEIFVDYIQLMESGLHDGKRQENRVQEVSQISRDLKGVARTLNVPVIALAQLSRAVESRQSKIPQLSDLRESGSLEQDADLVIFIYRDDVYNPETERPNQADFIVAKHRNGPIGEVTLYFKKSHTAFATLEVSPVEEV